jgi:hypothetical protein
MENLLSAVLFVVEIGSVTTVVPMVPTVISAEASAAPATTIPH